ncbi:glycoside hydrolase domain-containing protein [Parabacteroides gordonii]|jgi:putative alpha-1,2-mannosidase|uniref:glycoside hydrolase domain-containing protein n=1 Tax=Parabacteroides gordonii TaxID=574930 RepID=UPI0024201E0F|nr:glycoside hydrolase domain-containing protein [Parabacteroides gordonii]
MKLRTYTLLAASSIALSATAQNEKLTEYVRPLVGTDGYGNVYPGAQIPFGGIQISPDTDSKYYDAAAGYKYNHTSILGFSLTHLGGTGIPDLGDFLFIPGTGEMKLDPGSRENPDEGYRSRYTHEKEWASPNYYAVYPNRLSGAGLGERLGRYHRRFHHAVYVVCPARRTGLHMFNCAGFYPVAPSSNIYNVGSPCVEALSIAMSNGKEIKMTTENWSKENVYVKELYVNGKKYDKSYLTYDDVKPGISLHFVMSDKPNYKRAVSADAWPASVSSSGKTMLYQKPVSK